MAEQPQVIAFMVGGEIADDDPHRNIKLRALAISDAAEAWEDATRSAHVGACADRLEEAAQLLMDPAFGLEETWDAGRAAGLSDDDLEAAGNVAVLLWQVENLRQ